MKIISSYKDYYDHIAHLYGGGDPKITYARHRLGVVEQHSTDTFIRGLDIEQAGLPDSGFDELYRSFKYKTKWLAINGKLYLLLADVGDPYHPKPDVWTVLNETRHPQAWAMLHASRGWWHRDREPVNYLGREMPAVLELSRKLDAPVFTFTSSNRRSMGHVDGNVPILAPLGIPALISASQLYQDIAYFIGNTMKGAPDLMPATAQTNKEKITAAGFDLVQSFRHRK